MKYQPFKNYRSCIAAISLLTLSSCSSDIYDYKESNSPLNIKNYFTGNVQAWGMLQDYSQKVTRRFCVDIKGTWINDTGTLAETFYFQDGEVSYRTWTLQKLDNNQYTGKADDVEGIAKGKEVGIAFHWKYDLQVPIDDNVYVFHLDDWMYKIDNKRLFNRTSMQKLGVEVAEITLFFEKLPPHKAPNCRADM